jgi:putative Mg2+ transporter-C (MgtC) family protein
VSLSTLPVLDQIGLRLVMALLFGSLIGLERSYHGRPAGFRTHALVCMASTALMLVTVYEQHWFRPSGGPIRAAIDPTRMAQGIMTGIGFLGAGVIMKDGVSVRGLTTAASIWITAGLGILVGVGFFLPAALTTVLTFGALGGFRWIEQRMRTEAYAQFRVRFLPGRTLTSAEVVAIVAQHGLASAEVSQWYRTGEGMEYSMVVHSRDHGAAQRLSEALRERDDIAEFKLSPTGY